MSIKEKIEKTMKIFHAECATYMTIAQKKNFSKEQKRRLIGEIRIASSALNDAMYSISKDEADEYFLTPYSVALISMGVAHEMVGANIKKSELMQEYARKRLDHDPKQQEKTFIHECWNEWQRKPDSYASQAAFARDMLSKCEHLTSQKKIEDWCREWKQRTSPS